MQIANYAWYSGSHSKRIATYLTLYFSLGSYIAKRSWFTSNIGKLSCTSWYDDGDDDNGNDDVMVMMMLKMMKMVLTELKY